MSFKLEESLELDYKKVSKFYFKIAKYGFDTALNGQFEADTEDIKKMDEVIKKYIGLTRENFCYNPFAGWGREIKEYLHKYFKKIDASDINSQNCIKL